MKPLKKVFFQFAGAVQVEEPDTFTGICHASRISMLMFLIDPLRGNSRT